jgi:hypothetical protein
VVCCGWNATMNSRWDRSAAALAAALSASGPTLAHAQSSATVQDGERVTLSFSAPAGCPDRDAFVTAVQGYTDKAHFEQDGEVKRAFVVTIQRDAGKLQGNLEIVRGEEQSARTVSAVDCAELVDALALMTALAIDPAALGSDEPSPPPAEPAKPARPDRKPTPAPPARTAQPRDESDPAQLSVAALGLATWGVLPKLAWGGTLLGELRTRRRAELRATFTLGGGYSTHADQSQDAARVDYAALHGELSACAELAASSSWLGAFCAGGQLGRHKARVERPTDLESSSGASTYATLFAGPRVDLVLGEHWALRLQGTVGVHLIEQRVVLVEVDQDGDLRELTLNETSGLVLGSGLGVVFRL